MVGSVEHQELQQGLIPKFIEGVLFGFDPEHHSSTPPLLQTSLTVKCHVTK